MTIDEFDALEEELAALRPVQPPTSLQNGLANRLSVIPATSKSRVTKLAMLAAPLATSLLLLLALSHERPADVPVYRAMPLLPAETVGPTYQEYRRALAGAPDDIEYLLSHSAESSEGSSTTVPATPFLLRSDSDLFN